MSWIVDYIGNKVIFSKLFRKSENNWVEIYNWCNCEFNATTWQFWYDSTQIEKNAVIVNFEFLQECDAVQFQLRWG